MLLVLAARVELRQLRVLGPVLYLGSLLGLVAVLAIGSTINGRGPGSWSAAASSCSRPSS